MDFLDLLESRRSVQNFLPGKRIPRDDWRTLFERTCKAPSSWNLQPWKFLVIEDEARRAEIRKMAWDQPKVTECSALVLVLGDNLVLMFLAATGAAQTLSGTCPASSSG